MWNEDLDSDNYYPAIVMKVADPEGAPWNSEIIEIFPNEGEIDTDVSNYRSIEKNSAIASSEGI